MNEGMKALRVLILDGAGGTEGEAIRELIRWEELNLQRMEAAGAEEAIQLALHGGPDIVLADIEWPGMDVLELVRAARAVNADARFVLFGESREFETVHRALECGVSAYLLQPLSAKELSRALQTASCEFRARQRYRSMEEIIASGCRILREDIRWSEEEALDCRGCREAAAALLRRLTQWTPRQGSGACARQGRECAQRKASKPVRQAQKYISAHYGEKIVLNDVARVVGLNPVYLSVLFKKEMHVNFSAYLEMVRMREAREMICNTNETIAAISARVGYRDARYFSRKFEMAYGMKPTLYRRMNA